LTNKLVILGIAVLALAEILTVAGVVDLGLYLPGIEYQAAHILGHPKAVVGRLCVLGGFLCAMYLYSLKAPFWYVVIGLMVAGLLFSGSRAGILGLGVGLGVLGLRGRFGAKVGALAVLGVVVAGVVVLWHVAPERFERILADPYASLLGGRMSRWRIWVWTLSYLLTHAHVILTGVGFMNFQYALYGRGVPAQHGHNDYLTAFTELGLVGGVLFILFIYRLAKAAHRRLKATYRRRKWEALCFTAALGALVVTSLFEYCFDFAAGSLPMNRIFAMVFGVNTACWLQEAHQVEVWDLEAPQELGPYAGVEV
jgi:O-antigen ligase